MQRTPRLRLGFNAWHPSGVLDVLNSAGGLRCAPTSGYSLAGFQPARPGLREGYKNAAVAQPPACGVQPTRGSEIMAASQSAACGVAQPGGLEESSRGLSAAIPPDTGAKLVCTPEGCQLNLKSIRRLRIQRRNDASEPLRQAAHLASHAEVNVSADFLGEPILRLAVQFRGSIISVHSPNDNRHGGTKTVQG